MTSGGPIAAVELYRDGDLVARDSDPPYVQEVDIPRKRHVFEAVALDPMDRALDRAEQVVRREGRPFQVAVELDGPVREGRQALSAKVTVPQGRDSRRRRLLPQ